MTGDSVSAIGGGSIGLGCVVGYVTSATMLDPDPLSFGQGLWVGLALTFVVQGIALLILGFGMRIGAKR